MIGFQLVRKRDQLCQKFRPEDRFPVDAQTVPDVLNGQIHRQNAPALVERRAGAAADLRKNARRQTAEGQHFGAQRNGVAAGAAERPFRIQ